jgi:short-subunit dehydrogenase
MLPNDKYIVITGGLGGIGRPLVDKLLAAGAKITIADRCDSTQIPGVRYKKADLSDPASIDTLCESLRRTPPDILVNLAGLNAFCEFEAQPIAQLNAMLQVNLIAPMRLTHAVLPKMLRRGSGQIVNIGSVVGSIGLPHFVAYAATKSGLKGFSEALRREVAGRGVTVTHVAPRAVKTPMNHGAIDELNDRCGTSQDQPEVVADRILRAIIRDEPNVTVGFPEKLFVKINALWPRVVDGPLIKNRRIGESILATNN